ncbi:Heterokaryon incompatibility protein 6, OR allele [Colletotrichum shisoi]|uniref:Heterokaryon incompatibility protein 6, OR allele n=1 Tax=Colletotrichum shisoi TaxID=2078593 RepID=A0A5Q4BS81_9PEZI|nr:Heterokaryon incompatibility protein 6, OR allele [Colletotrichum shisoi]
MADENVRFFGNSISSDDWRAYDVDKQFKLASAGEHACSEADVDRARTWASTKTPAVAGGVPDASSPYRPIVDSYEIRVLEIKPGMNGDKLQGSLHHCSLELKGRFAVSVDQDNPGTPVSYTALSYTWGPPAFEGAILCDGHRKAITTSLEAALRAFRRKDKPVVMWIDQICINQEDHREKEQQIPLMTRIYQNATNTAIWLGESTSDSASAIMLLEDVRKLLQFTERDVEPKEFERLCLPSPDAEVWKALWDLFSRPWFTRLWIIQEVILSKDAWVVCGGDITKWDVLSWACLHLSTCGISRWLTQKFGSNDARVAESRDVCQSAWRLGTLKMSFESVSVMLFDLLVESREAQCYDSRDKVYGLLGVCQDSDRSAVKANYADTFSNVELYRNLTAHHPSGDPTGWRLAVVFTSIDHESPDLPSWVPDWRKTRRTASLEYPTTTRAVYKASGRFKTAIGKTDVVMDSQRPGELRVRGISVDTAVRMSDPFADCHLTYTNPAVSNKALFGLFGFVRQLQEYPGQDTVFSAFWNALVAGKDESGMAKAPSSFEEIISLLLDATTGLSPSLPGQTYSVRQRRPVGKGRLELGNLASRTPGKTFHEVETAMARAVTDRRLGITSRGYLGLFPENGKTGDEVLVLDGCHVPFLMRTAGTNRRRLVGECYLHGIMQGEGVENVDRLEEVVVI